MKTTISSLGPDGDRALAFIAEARHCREKGELERARILLACASRIVDERTREAEAEVPPVLRRLRANALVRAAGDPRREARA